MLIYTIYTIGAEDGAHQLRRLKLRLAEYTLPPLDSGGSSVSFALMAASH